MCVQIEKDRTDVLWLIVADNPLECKPGGGGLPEKLGGGVRPASQNPYPIYDQNLQYSLSYLWPDF